MTSARETLLARLQQAAALLNEGAAFAPVPGQPAAPEAPAAAPAAAAQGPQSDERPVTERVAEAQALMAATWERLRRTNIRDFEGLDADALDERLKPLAAFHVVCAYARAAEVLAFAAGQIERSGFNDDDNHLDLLFEQETDEFESIVDAVVTEGAGTFQSVEDVAFLVRLELRERLNRLDRVGVDQGTETLLGECDSAMRRSLKGLGALDAALAAASGLAPRLSFYSQLQTSLAVRNAYAKFQAEFQAMGEPDEEGVFPRMRSAGTVIAKLVGREIYPQLRVGDRLQLRSLQGRILTWLRDAARSPRDGLRIWQDLMAFVNMLSLVNRRQELVEHDRERVSALYASLSAPPEEFPARALIELRGLDAGLDAAWSADDLSLETLRPHVERLAGAYGVGEPILDPGEAVE